MTDAQAPSKFWLLLAVPMAAAILCFGGIFFWVLFPRVSDSGVEIGYRIPSADAAGLEPAVRRRLEALGVSGSSARVEQDLLILKIPGATPDTSARVRRLFATRGLLELRPAAPREVQKKYNGDQVVPAGYEVVSNNEPARGGEYEDYGAKLLVSRRSVIEGRQILHAETREERMPGGNRWVTAFELDAEGSKRFDEAAETLYNQRPPGLIAIILDGVLKSAPAVQSPAFHGKGQISGAKSEDDAKDLAIILRTGALPVKLGAPEFERPFGAPKK